MQLLENPVLIGSIVTIIGAIIGAIISAAVALFSTFLNNKNQREIAKLNVTYQHRLKIIVNFLSILIDVRHTLESFLYDGLGLEVLSHYKQQFLQLKQRLIEIRFSEKELYQDIKDDLEQIRDLTNYLIDTANIYSQSSLEGYPADAAVSEKMKLFIKLGKKVEKKIFSSKNV